MAGDVVFITKASSPYDIAVVQLKTDPPCESVQFASYFKPGNQFSFDLVYKSVVISRDL